VAYMLEWRGEARKIEGEKMTTKGRPGLRVKRKSPKENAGTDTTVKQSRLWNTHVLNAQGRSEVEGRTSKEGGGKTRRPKKLWRTKDSKKRACNRFLAGRRHGARNRKTGWEGRRDRKRYQLKTGNSDPAGNQRKTLLTVEIAMWYRLYGKNIKRREKENCSVSPPHIQGPRVGTTSP